MKLLSRSLPIVTADKAHHDSDLGSWWMEKMGGKDEAGGTRLREGGRRREKEEALALSCP